LEKKLAERASHRKLEDLTIGPVLTWTTDAMLSHMNKLLQIPGLLLRAYELHCYMLRVPLCCWPSVHGGQAEGGMHVFLPDAAFTL
jgi:hypothetical protein